jgi:hypothetical protein
MAAINSGRENVPVYYGTDTQRLAVSTTNIADGTSFLVFDPNTKALTNTYVWVSGIGWCTL